MCNYKSGIVMRDSREKGGFKLFMSPWTESHHELEEIFHLRDKSDNLAKVEFTPSDMAEAHKVETYKFRIDEDRKPEWFDDEMIEAVKAKMTAYIKSIIVDGDACLLIGGQFVIAPGARIECAKACVISAMCGGTLTAMWGGTLTEMRGGTLTAMWGGTLTAMCGGTLTEMRGGTLTAMWGGTLTEMRGGTLTEMRGGTLTAMCGGTLTEMRGGTLTEIVEWFSGVIGKIIKPAKIFKDNRPKQKTATSKK